MAKFGETLSTPMSGKETIRPASVGKGAVASIFDAFGGIGDAIEGAAKTRQRDAAAARQAAQDKRQYDEDALKAGERLAANDLAENLLQIGSTPITDPLTVDPAAGDPTFGDTAGVAGSPALTESEQMAIGDAAKLGQTVATLDRAREQGRMTEAAYELKVEGMMRSLFAKYPSHKAFLFEELNKTGMKSPIMSEWRRAAEANDREAIARDARDEKFITLAAENGYDPELYDRGDLIRKGIHISRTDEQLKRIREEADEARKAAAEGRAQTGFDQGQLDRVETARSLDISDWITTRLGPDLGDMTATLNDLANNQQMSTTERIKMLGPLVTTFITKGRAKVDEALLRVQSDMKPEDREATRKRMYDMIDQATTMFNPSNPLNIIQIEAKTLGTIEARAGLQAHEALPLYTELRQTFGNAEGLAAFVDTVFANPKVASALGRELKGFSGLEQGQQTVRLKNAIAIIKDENTQLRDLTPQEGAVALRDATKYLDRIYPAAVNGQNPGVTRDALNTLGKVGNAGADQSTGTGLESLVRASEYIANDKSYAIIRTAARSSDPATAELANNVADITRVAAQKNIIALRSKPLNDQYHRIIYDIGARKFIIAPTGKQGPSPIVERGLGRRLMGSTPPPTAETKAVMFSLNRNLKFLDATSDFEDKMDLGKASLAERSKFYATGQIPASIQAKQAPNAPSNAENISKLQRFWDEMDVDFQDIEPTGGSERVDRSGVAGAIEGAENSTGNPAARNPNSSAMGNGQFIKSTWMDMVQKHRPDLMKGRTKEQVLALRADPAISREMTQAYAEENAERLRSKGITPTKGAVYLAHFAGPEDAVKVLQADDDTPLEQVLNGASISANSFLRGKTVKWLKSWANQKMGRG